MQHESYDSPPSGFNRHILCLHYNCVIAKPKSAGPLEFSNKLTLLLPPFLKISRAFFNISLILFVGDADGFGWNRTLLTAAFSVSRLMLPVSSMTFLAASVTVIRPTCVCHFEIVKPSIIVWTKLFCSSKSDGCNFEEESRAKTTSMGNGHAANKGAESILRYQSGQNLRK